MVDLADFAHMVPLDHGLSVVITRRADLTPHTSVVNAGVVRQPFRTGLESVAFVSARGTHKLINLRMDPTVAVVIRAGWQWASVEGRASLVGPDDPEPGLTTSGCVCCCGRSSVQQEGSTTTGRCLTSPGTRGTYCGVRGSAAVSRRWDDASRSSVVLRLSTPSHPLASEVSSGTGPTGAGSSNPVARR